LFFLLLTPRPPSSPLFPYTTLFRSDRRGRDGVTARQHDADQHASLGLVRQRLDREPEKSRESEQSEQAVVSGVRPEQGDVLVFGDRKSTRLNSSHVAISYAVFCLKK